MVKHLITLRLYQTDLVNRVRLSYKEGKRAPLVCLSTGGGKTTIFAYVTASAAEKGKCVYLLAHRAELCRQISMTLSTFGTKHQVIAPGPIVRQIQVEQFKAFGRTFIDSDSKVFVASVQTLVRRIADYPAADIIVCDEAHHLTMNSTWGQIVSAHPKARLLPVTATPCRMDGKGLGVGQGGFADDIIMGPSMRELIDAGYLSKYRIFAPPNSLDLSNVKSRAGDYAKDQLAIAMDKPSITGSSVEHWKKLANGKRAIAFCVSIAHAQNVAHEFTNAGIKSECLDGTMDALKRDAAIKRFKSGETLVLTSCDIVSEGFDLPAIEVAILLRPTQSLSLYLQQIGRALRTFDGKSHAIILDHVGAVMKHGLPDEEREWTLDGVKKTSKPKQEETPIQTCTQCFAIHEPARVCPVCGFEHPIKERKLEQQEGDLVEIDDAALEAMRRQKRVMQGRAQTVEDLMRQGIGRARAIKILQARHARQQLVDEVVDKLTNTKEKTGIGPYQACGYTFAQIRMCKPKELKTILALLG
jgi:superfamily II DNA or RNA helicase